MREAGRPGFVVPVGRIVGPTPPQLRFVYLTINRVEQIDRPEDAFAGQADYYAKVRIDGAAFSKSKHREDQRVVTPNWFFGFAFSNITDRTVPIQVEIWDHDSTSADDMCDISPVAGKRRLDLTYDTATGRIAGDVGGTRDVPIAVRGVGDSDRAAIQFTITSR
jgi:hypothetical protein